MEGAGFSAETRPACAQADVVVVGEGFAGLSTALSAAERGLGVVIVTASKRPVGRGGAVFASWSKVMQAQGFSRQEVERFYLDEFASQAYAVDQRKWYRFYNRSEEAMNWLIDHLEGSGVRVVLEQGNADYPGSPSDQPVGTHGFMVPGSKLAGSGIAYVLKTMEEKFLALGGRVFRNCAATELVRANGGQGRVCAVLARDENGAELRFSATRAVVLCTGDFSADPEMMRKYCPVFAPFFNGGNTDYDAGMVTGGLYRGEGHKMALRAGAAWQRTFPNAVMVQGSRIGSHMPNGSHRGLRLNVRGERYCNEDCNGAPSAIGVLREPERKAWGIWGSNYARELEWRAMGTVVGTPVMSTESVLESWENGVKAGKIVKADTLEALVEKLGMPKERALAEIERYNAFCRAGRDEDFHKRAEYLQEIREAPFYAGILHDIRFLTVLGGPRTNADMQICGEDDRPIPGLYGVGSIVGDMFSGFYNYRMAGQNYGACLTFGYLTGRFIAENTQVEAD